LPQAVVEAQTVVGLGTLTVVKSLSPNNDPGRFNLLVDGIPVKVDAGNGDSTVPLAVTAGDHTVDEAAGTGTDLADYNASINCVNGNAPVLFAPTGSGPWTVTINDGDNITCTITNVRKTVF
jgi:hypothetical protein